MIRRINQIIAIILWIVGIIMLCAQSKPVIGALFFVPFVLGPHAVSHVGVYLAKGMKAQAILMFVFLAYFGWFAFVYIDVFYIHIDPQSPIALLFVGIYAVPVLAVLWLAALWIEKKSRGQQVAATDD